MAPLTATVNFIHSDACQTTHVVRFLQFGHEQFAFGDFLRRNVQHLEGAVFIYHACQDPLGVLLRMQINIGALHSNSYIYNLKYCTQLDLQYFYQMLYHNTFVLEEFSVTAATSMDLRYIS